MLPWTECGSVYQLASIGAYTAHSFLREATSCTSTAKLAAEVGGPNLILRRGASLMREGSSLRFLNRRVNYHEILCEPYKSFPIPPEDAFFPSNALNARCSPPRDH